MRVTKEILEKTTTEAVGADAIEIVMYLKGKENISEFVIAEDLKVDIHFVRNALYRLNSDNLATYIRKKDRVKGWYISYWTINTQSIFGGMGILEADNGEITMAALINPDSETGGSIVSLTIQPSR